MKLGFVSAILAELSLEEVLAFAREAGFPTVELMCWPAGKAERRYAGVTHLDVKAFDDSGAKLRAVKRVGSSTSGWRAEGALAQAG